MQDTSTDHLRK